MNDRCKICIAFNLLRRDIRLNRDRNRIATRIIIRIERKLLWVLAEYQPRNHNTGELARRVIRPGNSPPRFGSHSVGERMVYLRKNFLFIPIN